MTRLDLHRRTFLAAGAGLALGGCQTDGSGPPQIVTFSHWFLPTGTYDPTTVSNDLGSGARTWDSLDVGAGKCAYLASFAPGDGFASPNHFSLSLFGNSGSPPAAFQLIGIDVSNLSTEDSCAIVNGVLTPARLARGLDLSSPQSISLNTYFTPAAATVRLGSENFIPGTLARRARLTNFNPANSYCGGDFDFLAQSATMPGLLVVVRGSFTMTGRRFTS